MAVRILRREFVLQSGLLVTALGGRALPRGPAEPARRAAVRDRPLLLQGIQIGDAYDDRATVWSRADRPSRMLVEWDTSERFSNPRRLSGPHALSDSDFTARLELSGLPAGEAIFLRVYFESLANERARSEPVLGSFRAAGWKRGALRFVWGGDTAGQGYGINPDFGGMPIFETMRRREPDFFLQCGDAIYADKPIPAETLVEGGKVWRNLVTEEKSKVAETLAEFRGNYKYNLLDENVRRFNAQVPQVWQWDDHEVSDNWSTSKDLSRNDAYIEKRVPVLMARGARAFREYAPLGPIDAAEPDRLYRRIPYGDLMELFVLDMRRYRAPNSYNRQSQPSAETAFLGAAQLQWLQQGLLRSTATWKLIAADMPLGLQVPDGRDASGRPRFDAVANGDGPVLGREHEIAALLKFIKDHTVRNVVWLTADVHYAAAHYYDPERARFSDFDPFWEFVAGPLHAGTFGPAAPDDTFGLQVVFQKCPPVQNYSPLGRCQFFGQVDIERDRSLTVSLVDLDGKTLFQRGLSPRPGRGA